MSLQRCKKNLDYTSKEVQYQLARRLNSLCKKLNESFGINYGGCCYVAYCIARLLEKDNFNFSLVVFDKRYELKKFVELSELPEPMDHYAIIIESDDASSGINCCEDDYDDFYQDFKVSSKHILEYYLNNRWNSSYNIINNVYVKSLIERVYYEFTDNLRKE